MLSPYLLFVFAFLVVVAQGGTVLMQRNTAGNTVSSAPNTILSVTIPANALATDGDQIEMTFDVTATATSGTFQGQGDIQWAGSTVALSSPHAFTWDTTTSQNGLLLVFITRLSSSSAMVNVVYNRYTGVSPYAVGTLTGLDFTVTNTLSSYLFAITGGTGTVRSNFLATNVFQQ